MAIKSKEPVGQEYIAMVTLANAEGTERWYPGSKVIFDDATAAIHLRLGNIAPMDNTTPPSDPEPAIVEHVAEVTT